jgi:phosphate transport system permease protein
MTKKYGNSNTFKSLILASVLFICLIFLVMFIILIIFSLPSLSKFGFNFFISTNWDPVTGDFGALPFILGTLFTSLIALAISIPFALSIALFLGEYFHTGPVSTLLNSAMELLAGIPSIIYGMWGLFILVPVVRAIQIKFGIPPLGVGIFTAALLLSIMIIPYAASISREVISLVPNELKEAAYSLGATRYEVVKKVIFPFSGSGIIAGILLAFGRALGETMAVTMVIGNSYFMPTNIFGPGHTISSLIANEFTEATDKIYLSSLIEMGLILFIITIVFGVLGRFIIQKLTIQD